MTIARLRRCVAVVTFLLAATSASASPITINFESLSEDEFLTTQFPDLVFANAKTWLAGITLNEDDFPPHSGDHVIGDEGGAILISFLQPVYSLSGYFTYLTPITLTAYDSGNNVIGSLTSASNSNNFYSDTPSPNELMAFNSLIGISSITLNGNPSGGSFTLDDFTYDNEAPPVGNVPDSGPGMLSLITLAVVGLAAASMRSK